MAREAVDPNNARHRHEAAGLLQAVRAERSHGSAASNDEQNKGATPRPRGQTAGVRNASGERRCARGAEARSASAGLQPAAMGIWSGWGRSCSPSGLNKTGLGIRSNPEAGKLPDPLLNVVPEPVARAGWSPEQDSVAWQNAWKRLNRSNICSPGRKLEQLRSASRNFAVTASTSSAKEAKSGLLRIETVGHLRPEAVSGSLPGVDGFPRIYFAGLLKAEGHLQWKIPSSVPQGGLTLLAHPREGKCGGLASMSRAGKSR